jgi:hypothetical protein
MGGHCAEQMGEKKPLCKKATILPEPRREISLRLPWFSTDKPKLAQV